MTGNEEKTASTACQQQVRAGHVTKGYHRLQQDDTLQQTSDSERASRSGSASDELDLDSDISNRCYLLKAAFNYSSKLQTWLSTCVSVSKVRRKQVESMSKASRKHVANPHELVKNLAAKLVESQVCSQVCSLLE